MRKRIAALTKPLLALVVFGFAITIRAQAACTGSSPTWNSTVDSASVTTCISNAASGETVNVAAGSASWTVTITKAIHFQGTGSASTIITGGVTYSPNTTEATKVFEMNGFTFQGTGAHFSPSAPDSTHPITGLKIHDNAFNGSNPRAIVMAGLEFGVFYNNTFSGNFISVSVIGAGWGGESYPHAFGSANYPYFEDNTFGNGTGEFVSETGQGGRLVFRHNTVSGYACSGCEVFDLHGDQGSGTTISSEYYHNTIGVGASGTYRWMHHRGGQAIIANNTVSRNIGFNFTEYRSVGNSSVQSPANPCTPYPIILNSSYQSCSPNNESTCIETQIHNSFYWGNTAGGVSSTPGYTFGNGGSCGSDPPWGDNQYIQQNREYWLPTSGLASALPATCTADGNTYYGATDTDAIYKCTSTNNWSVFYQPYTYPHPLRSGSADPIPPTNLAAVVH